ncbi:prenyltransferase/squalene oxidase repeat-containing protein [Spirillospora sp. CA-253888]
MTPNPTRTARSAPSGFPDVVEAADRLVAGLLAEPWGRSSPSVYETGRLVSLAPWLTGHAERLRFLVDTQRPDGSWSAPSPAYALVPTLSATEAVLSAIAAGETAVEPALLVKCAVRGLEALTGPLADPPDLPDMPAIEHITPALVARIGRLLDRMRERPPAGLEHWTAAGPPPAPAGMDGALLPMIGDLLDRGTDLPEKLLHALEIAGEAAVGAPSVPSVPAGENGPADPAGAPRTIGASPAATAAWLGPDGSGGALSDPAEAAALRRYLDRAARQHGGPVPVAVPITNFERGWVLGWLVRAGVPVQVPSALVVAMRASLGPSGVPGGAGLPDDADSSSGLLYALSLLGAPCPPDLLWKYETDTHFCTWQGENGHSITTNAHVLEAFGHYLAGTEGGADTDRYAESAGKAASWLRARQGDDGRWHDRWHVSPYYATFCAALALDAFGGPESAESVARAVRWVLATQNADGSWGDLGGTAEETAYALQLLLLARNVPAEAAGAVAQGAALLRAAVLAGEVDPDKPPLWHDKDLYRPVAIVWAAVLAALHLADSGGPVSAT